MEATELRLELYQLAAAEARALPRSGVQDGDSGHHSGTQGAAEFQIAQVEDDFPPWALGSRPNRFTFSSPVAKAQPRGAAQ